MRIVGGRHRGRPIEAPPGGAVRPTSDRARQALFNILDHGPFAADGPPYAGRHVLDAFAGTGAVGLEALSRGATSATFIDLMPRWAEANAALLGETARARILAHDVLHPPSAPGGCALVFLDPPYGKGLGEAALTALRQQGWIAADTLLALELAARDPFDPPAGFRVADERRYGAARLLFLICD